MGPGRKIPNCLELSLSRHIRAGFGPLCGRVCWGGTHAPPWSSKWAELQAAGAPASSGPVTLHSTSCGCRDEALEMALAASHAQKCGRSGGTVAAYRPLPLRWVAASHHLRRSGDANRRPRHSGCPLVVALLAVRLLFSLPVTTFQLYFTKCVQSAKPMLIRVTALPN